MIKLEATFSCVCPAIGCEEKLDAANWETALAEAQLMHCRNGHERYVVREVILTEYDEKGCLTDLELVSEERRKLSSTRMPGARACAKAVRRADRRYCREDA